MTVTQADPVAAAAGAMERYCDDLGIEVPSPALARALGKVAVDAAAPLVAAAERERCARLADSEAKRIASTGAGVGYFTLQDFAELLREQP